MENLSTPPEMILLSLAVSLSGFMGPYLYLYLSIQQRV